MFSWGGEGGLQFELFSSVVLKFEIKVGIVSGAEVFSLRYSNKLIFSGQIFRKHINIWTAKI